MVNRYSLADYTVKVTLPERFMIGSVDFGGTILTFGGAGTQQEGSFMGQIVLRRTNSLYTTTGDPTGSWVHTKSLDRTGTIEMQIRQVSDDIVKLGMIVRALEQQENDQDLGILIEVFKGDESVAKGEDCVIEKHADVNYGENPENQSWNWLSGRITFTEGNNSL